jgi:hypothetical protein
VTKVSQQKWDMVRSYFVIFVAVFTSAQSPHVSMSQIRLSLKYYLYEVGISELLRGNVGCTEGCLSSVGKVLLRPLNRN